MRITIGSPGDPLTQRACLSGLFFNHEHPSYDAAVTDTGDDDAATEALVLDATNFCEMLKNATGVELDPVELAADFMARL